MDIKDLRCFLAVAEKLNFSRAAESLYMSQPALSLRINTLEKELGVSLFSRTHQRVYLLPAGASILPEIRELVSRFDRLPTLAKDNFQFASEQAGRINMGLDDFFTAEPLVFLANIFKDFYRKYPNIKVDLDTIHYSSYQSALINRDYDICLLAVNERNFREIPSRFNTIPLARDEMVLAYVGEEEPMQSLLQSRELLLIKGDSWNKIIINYLKSRNLNVKMQELKAGASLTISLIQENTMTYMPRRYYRFLQIPSLHYHIVDVPDAAVITSLVWDCSNYNPALQFLINCFDAYRDFMDDTEPR